MMMLPRIRRNKGLTAVLCVLLLFAACTNRLPSGVLPPEKLEAILYDYHLAQSMISDLPTSERYQKDLYFDYVYAKHGVTAEVVDSSLVYYARNPKELSEIYLKLTDRVERTMQRIEDETVLTVLRVPKAVEGDSADLWYERPLLQMSPSYIANRFSATVPYDTNFKSNDSFEWSGDVLFFNPDPDSLRRYLHLSLVVEFDNDSLASVDTLLYTSGSYRLSLPDTTGFKLRNVISDAYYKGYNGDDELLLYNLHLMRYHQVAPADTLLADTTIVKESVNSDTLNVKPAKSSKRTKKVKNKQS